MLLDMTIYPNSSLGYVWRAVDRCRPAQLHFFRYGEEYSLCRKYRIQEYTSVPKYAVPTLMEIEAQCMVTSVVRRGLVLLRSDINVVSMANREYRICPACAAQAVWVRVKLMRSRVIDVSTLTTTLPEVNLDMLEG